MNNIKRFKTKARILMWIQFVLMIGVASSAFFRTTPSFGHILNSFGAMLFLAGSVFFVQAIFALQKSKAFTPDPVPKANANLITVGVYGVVRHPIYTAGLLMCFGWALFFSSVLAILFSFLLCVVLNLKAGLEERFLQEIYPEYKVYSSKVGRLVPKVPLNIGGKQKV